MVLAGCAFAAAVGVIGSVATRPADARDRTGFSAAQQSPGAAPTLKVYSRETYVDVSVTDAEGRPVHGLTRDDFTVLEDGVAMEPNSFAEHRSDTQTVDATAPAKEKLPPNTFSNVDAAQSDGPINILLFDSSDLPVMTQHILQTQMLDFVNKMRPGTRAAVVRMTYHLSILQGITTDRELIRAAIQSDKIAPGSFALEDPQQDWANVDLPGTPRWADPLVGDIAEWGGAPPPENWLAMLSARAEYGLTAMKQLARFLEGMPGRKNLIWFTGFAPSGSFSGALVSEVDLLSRAHVTIYPMDPRGDEIHATPFVKRAKAMEDATMTDVAEQTGGTFFAGREVGAAVERILDRASDYYTLTYVPTEKAATSGQFRNITVKVNRPGVKLTYRPGYYATDPMRSLNNMKLIPQPTAMQAAMERGGLEPTQILFHMKVDPGATDGTVSAGNRPEAKGMKPPFRHLAVTYTIDIGSMAFERGGDGKYRANFEFGVMVYDADGKLVSTASKQVRPVVTAAAYQSMLKDGAVAHEAIDVPAHGEYWLRVGVHDLANDKVGALEVPTSSLADANPTQAR
jgi:VWFA-related protein